MSEAPAEGDGAGKGKEEIDEDYVPGKKSLPAKRRPHLSRKPTGPKAVVGNGNLLEAGTLGNRRGTTEPVECPTCHKSFLSKYYLKIHNRQVWASSERGLGQGEQQRAETLLLA